MRINVYVNDLTGRYFYLKEGYDTIVPKSQGRLAYRINIKERFCKCEGTCERSGPNFFAPYVPESFVGHNIKCKLVNKPKQIFYEPYNGEDGKVNWRMELPDSGWK